MLWAIAPPDVGAGPGGGDGTNEDDVVATTVILDSDQCHCVPIRGSPRHAALGYPARAVDRRPASSPAFLPSSNDDVGEEQPYLVVGIRIDPTASRRIVDRGPPAEDVRGWRQRPNRPQTWLRRFRPQSFFSSRRTMDLRIRPRYDADIIELNTIEDVERARDGLWLAGRAAVYGTGGGGGGGGG